MEYTTCERTGKRCYSKTDANYAVNQASRKHWHNGIKNIPKRAYLCRFCGAYHLTKEKAKHDHNRKKNALSARSADDRRRAERLDKVIQRYTREYR